MRWSYMKLYRACKSKGYKPSQLLDVDLIFKKF